MAAGWGCPTGTIQARITAPRRKEVAKMPRRNAPWYRRSKQRWYVTHNGKQTALPVTDPADQAGAWDAFRQLVQQAVRDAQSPPTVVRSEPVGELISDYLASLTHKAAPRTIRGYAVYLRRFGALFGNLPAAQIDVEAVLKAAHAEAWSDSNRANYLWAVQAFLRWCGRSALRIERPAKESRGAEAVIPEAIYRAVLRETTGDLHQLVRLWWLTGCRPMEGAGLTAEMIDWSAGVAILKQHKTRRKGKQRVLYFCSEALKVLQEQTARYHTGPLFRGRNGRALTLRAIVGRMIRVSKKIGHPVTAGCFRHTFATRALERGVPDTHVAALLGHASTVMVHKHYGHLTANAKLLREQAERVAS